MNKALVIADIHINDYVNRNPSNRFRLLQSRTVAQNIIDGGKMAGCDRIIFAGDIVEKSVIRPYVQAEVKRFLDTIMANFKEGYIIWGNHDLDGKSVDQDISDACLGVMLPNNLYYSHKQIIEIAGRKIAFSNWMPEFDLSWIPGKVDILFTHATICYSKDPSQGKMFESQKLDESKFDLAICGDIHQKGQIGKYVSVGCCQRCKLGDQVEATGVVVDFDNLTWDWIDLNPKDNLMKFEVTDVLDQEGWDASRNTWYVYKQDTSLLDSNGTLKVEAWKEIDALVTNAIISSGLGDVHGKILSGLSQVNSGEVDFNFTLLHLHCENWRSIESVDIDFNDMDKILLIGANGSGKSSLLSAIKYSLCDVGDSVGLSSLKPFIQFGKKDCLTEITFLYQGNICKIQRGTATNKYGLWINDEKFKYNSKKAFEKDVRERFPFIRYMDAFFFDADKNSFLKSLSPERITEITSKFLKLDKINALNETAKLYRDQLKEQDSGWSGKYKEVEEVYNYIKGKFETIRSQLPQLSEDQLIEQRTRGEEIQRKNKEWTEYIKQSSSLVGRSQVLSERINELTSNLSQSRSLDVIDSEIISFQNTLRDFQSQLIQFGNIDNEINHKEREYQNLREQGNNYWTEAQKIVKGGVCTLCGQPIKSNEASERHKNELLKKVDDLRPIIGSLKAELENLYQKRNNSMAEKAKLESDIKGVEAAISNRMYERNSVSRIVDELENTKRSYEQIQIELSKLNPVEEVVLPDNFLEMMRVINTGIHSWQEYKNTEKELNEKQAELMSYQREINAIRQDLNKLEDYIKLTGPTGVIFEEIFDKLSKQFSSNTVKYGVKRETRGRSEHLILTPSYNNSGNLVPINLCSSGQRTLLDIDYMSKIIDRLGLLVLDEFFKNLDNDRLEEVLDILKTMNIGCMILTSHAESIPTFNNKTCIMSLNNSGLTEMIFR